MLICPFSIACADLSRSISQHHYSAAFCSGGAFPLTSFMSKSAVRGNLSDFAADIAATKERGMTYVLGYAFGLSRVSVMFLTVLFIARLAALLATVLLVLATWPAPRCG